MSKRIRISVFILTFGSLLAVTIFAIATIQRASSLAAPHSDNFGTVKFIVSEDKNGKRAMITYPHQGKSDLEEYGGTNRNMLEELIKQDMNSTEVRVVFARPISAQELEQVVSDFGIDVKSYILRGKGQDGERATIFGAPDQNQLIPTDYWQQTLEILNEKNGNSKIAGFITVEGEMTTNNAKRLSMDNRVFVVDVSVEFVRRQLQSEFEHNVPVRVDNIFPLYWFLEDNGLTQSRE